MSAVLGHDVLTLYIHPTSASYYNQKQPNTEKKAWHEVFKKLARPLLKSSDAMRANKDRIKSSGRKVFTKEKL